MAEGINRATNPITITLKGKGLNLVLPLGVGRAVPTAGGPVYGEGPRPQRKALTLYEGLALVRLSVPILLDSTQIAIREPRGLGLKNREDVWPIVEQIYGLCRPGKLGHLPPAFKIEGPIPFSGLLCQMEWPELQTEPEPWVEGDGRVVRQGLTLKLVEFQNPDPLSVAKGPIRNEGNAGGGIGGGLPVKAEVLKEGETLLRVAARIYGDPGKAKIIGEQNGIRDVREKLKKGRVLGLPRSAET